VSAVLARSCEPGACTRVGELMRLRRRHMTCLFPFDRAWATTGGRPEDAVSALRGAGACAGVGDAESLSTFLRRLSGGAGVDFLRPIRRPARVWQSQRKFPPQRQSAAKKATVAGCGPQASLGQLDRIWCRCLGLWCLVVRTFGWDECADLIRGRLEPVVVVAGVAASGALDASSLDERTFRRFSRERRQEFRL